MHCDEVSDFTDDYFENSISEEIRIEIDKHLAECFHCSSLFNSINSYYENIKNFHTLIETPASILKEISDELSGDKKDEPVKSNKKSFNLFQKFRKGK